MIASTVAKNTQGTKINCQHMEQNAKCGGKPNHSAAKCKSKIRRSKVHYVEDDEPNSDNDYRISTVIHHIWALNAKTSKKNMEAGRRERGRGNASHFKWLYGMANR